MLYVSKVRCLSRGKRFERFWNLRDGIKNFMQENYFDVLELEENQSLLDLCFLADITKNLNQFILQGEEKLITDCYESIQVFVTNLNFTKINLHAKMQFIFFY